VKNEFEAVFSEFVADFGGEMLPEPSDAKIADYLFRKQNIVAELKCLMCDQTEEMNKKVTRVAQEWYRKHRKLPSGYDGRVLEIAKAPKEISNRWLEILKAPIENFIKDANRQIRSTKQRLNLADAKGLLLIFNQGNPLHNRPKDFSLLLGSVLRKRKPNKERKFTHIHGLVYFSFETVKTEKERMSFWAPVQLKTEPGEDVTAIRDFQKELEQAWYAFVEKNSGRIVRQHSVE
jgi:hypothetical protein